MMNDLVRVERHGRTERIILHRPEARNALSSGLLRELTVAVRGVLRGG
jgi:enoyl-CoA hydratase/carnithine racemase